MSRWLLLVLGMTLMAFCYASWSQVPFTPEGIASLEGKDVCNLQGVFNHQLSVYLDRRKEHAVDCRERDGIIALFLLSKPTIECGVVDAALNLTPLIKKNETVQFKCYTAHEGGTTWGKLGHVIGLADNKGGTKRFVGARLAWRVNVKEKRFEEIKGEKVVCDTAGYEAGYEY
jgi:hypothetical protein